MDKHTVQKEILRYVPALLLRHVVRGKLYTLLRGMSLLILVVCIALFLYAGAEQLFLTKGTDVSILLSENRTLIGVGMLTLAFLLTLRSFNFYFNTFYFWGINENEASGITYEVAWVCTRYPRDLTKGLFVSTTGKLLLLRLGIEKADLATFIASDREKIGSDSITASDTQYTVLDLINHLYASDASFATFLKKQGVTTQIFEGAAAWSYVQHVEKKKQQQWWSKEMLSMGRGLGSEFSFGVPYTLQRFTRSIRSNAIFSNLGSDAQYGTQYMHQIETILVRNSEANVLLVGEPGVGKMDILMQIGKRMESGVALGSLIGKHITVLDTELLLANQENKMGLEQTLIHLLSEATNAGNIILVIDNVQSFIESAHALKVDVPALLDPYLNTPELHIVATTGVDSYHTDIEVSNGFLRRFQIVQIEEPDEASAVHLLQGLVKTYEKHTNVRLTYAGVSQIAADADRYIVHGVMPDKAVQLLDEVMVYARSNRISMVTASAVDTVVARKTGVPVGPVTVSERDTLLNLEEVLHKRIVGQNRAVEAISGVMRRSRAGIQDENKPIGSFLFLGPTGVGKTECAKALASVFFKDEEAMHRIDMSEFSGSDAVDRLIGVNGVPGVLSNMLSEHPYSVVLLDEFEKASTSVHDLFLQILDEGMFTDGNNRKVHARNSIFIATSNAGSQQILAWVEEGKDLEASEDELVGQIISEGLFKPELINRFDDTIVFEPLDRKQQAHVARAMLLELQERIEKKGFILEVTDALIDTLVTVGYKPEFGARPMQRAIQEVVEEAIAEKIIAGSLAKGDTITFSEEELEGFKK
ncbi:MAG: ATP-dependent Clp protease ATP-binding subunit ClpC [Patiriisocius sp.]|jgi:ATP-dependent Clp protease ATP-binding subunit ClpC